jgi:hypothetical protein
VQIFTSRFRRNVLFRHRKGKDSGGNGHHPLLEGAGHFLQEDAGEELGTIIADFIRATLAAKQPRS